MLSVEQNISILLVLFPATRGTSTLIFFIHIFRMVKCTSLLRTGNPDQAYPELTTNTTLLLPKHTSNILCSSQIVT